MEKRFDKELSATIDNRFGENTKKASPSNVVEAALEEFGLKEEEFNSVISFAELLELLQIASPSTSSHAALVGFAAGLIIGKVLSERKGGGK